MLIVVAITVILMGAAFVGVQGYQRSTTRLEFDTIAKEIFIAAQNHLTTAQSQGYLQLDSKTDGSKKSTDKAFGLEGDSAADTNGDERYFVYNKTSSPYSTDPQEVQSVLDLMLPFGAIDETVRAGGTYIIRYQPSSGRVLDVFYSLPGKSSMLTVSGVELVGGDYKTLMSSDYTDQGFRERYKGGVVGWYGGEAGLPIGTRLNDPEMTVHNEEVLWVEVKNNNTKGSCKLIVTGATSGAQKAFDLSDVATTDRMKDGSVTGTVKVILDDITTSLLHFADLASDVENKSFIPGENVIIEAVAYNNDALSNVAYSGKKTTNSLFADLEVKKENASEEHIALIENFRHFENLDKTVSGFQHDRAVKKQDGTAETIGKAEQIRDLDWNSETADSFIKAVAAINGHTPAGVYGANNLAVTEGGCFYPVSPVFTLSYRGQGHKISNVTANHSGAAGLFGVLADESEVKDLELIDFRITSSSGNAGALVGTAEGDNTIEITNVVAHNKSISGIDSTISGAVSAGGLIGAAANCTVSKCGAALVVTSTGGDAGGLIGTSAGGTVTASYSGGHTNNAKYYTEAGEPIYNVTAAGSAGGLIGDAGDTGISYSYSTCSATGATAGGFVGEGSGTMTSCYCTGLVSGSTGKGAFSGSLTGTATDCRYFEMINELKGTVGYTYLEAVNNAEYNGITALDESIAAYQTFSGSPENDWKTAFPYDTVLTDYYGSGTAPNRTSRFNMKTVEQLGATLKETDTDTSVYLVEDHFGDWPAPEILVVNPS